ncbi:MAG TPA: Sec-independent protein translocase protein TatB [Parvularculaceae bacterium]|nr:Sec-independent protein translocase protein TatB [Parvularculaceae bacterium]
MNLVPQVGFFEIVVIAVVALVVVGPKDLPKLMRMAGRMVREARRLAGEFTAAFDQMARESEMEEMRKEIEALKHDGAIAEAKRAVEDVVRPIDEAARKEASEIREAVNRPTAPLAAIDTESGE